MFRKLTTPGITPYTVIPRHTGEPLVEETEVHRRDLPGFVRYLGLLSLVEGLIRSGMMADPLPHRYIHI